MSCATKLGQIANAMDVGSSVVGAGQAIEDIASNGLSLGNAASLAANLTGVVAGTRYQNCFPAGTLVSAEQGLQPIEDVRNNDRVWAYNLTAGEWAFRPVLETYEFVNDEFVELRIGGEKIVSTAGHPFWVVRGENLTDRPRPEHISEAEAELVGKKSQLTGRWVDAQDLQPGDLLFLRGGRQVPVDSINLFCEVQKTYNFAVDDLHCYAVGNMGVLVHNGCGDTALAKQLGRDGEVAAGIVNPKRQIESITGTATHRFPDELIPNVSIREVKSVSRQSFTNQLRDSLYYSLTNNIDFILVVRKGTQLSGPLQSLNSSTAESECLFQLV